MAIKKKKSIKKAAAKKATSSKVKKATVAKTAKKITKKSVVKKPIKKVAAKKVVKKVARPTVVKKAAKKAPSVAAKKSAPKKQTKPSRPVVVKKAVKKVVIKKVVIAVKPKIKEKPLVAPAEKTAVTSTEKVVKIGVKTKKQLVVVAPQPVIEISNHPKSKIKTILISQPKPENDKNPYYELSKKYNLIETFRQFIKIEGLPVKDFRAQRIDILEHKAVILTSRMAVDHYFRMCNEMRVTVPESMKYFCINEATAYYLQKYIQYRKRKIFFGHQTIQDLVDVIRKNREEKFLLPAADVQKEQICDFLDAISIKYTKAVMYRTVSADLSDIKNLNEFDCLVFFTPAGINSLKHNFPNFKQGNTRIACFGAATANTLKKHGYRLDVYAPNPKNPSMSGALDEYMKEANKR
jgi:uroporphyrinogen-III synthase